MADERDIGYPMEMLVGDFLHLRLPKAIVQHEPYELQTYYGTTLPDWLIDIPDSKRLVFVDVTVSGYRDGSRKKAGVLRVYSAVNEEEDRAGLVLFQENIMMVESLAASLFAIERLASGELSGAEAQELLTNYAIDYNRTYAVYRSSEVRWDLRARGLRKALEMD